MFQKGLINLIALNKKYKLGENDCYQLVLDYYKEILNIKLMELKLPERLSISKAKNFIEFTEFKEVDHKSSDLNEHDILLFNNNGNGIHCGVYLGNKSLIHITKRTGSAVIDNLNRIPFKLLGAYRHETLF